jgi:hypothetical protein
VTRLEAKAGKTEASLPRAQEQLGVQGTELLAGGPQLVDLDRRVQVHVNLQRLQRRHRRQQPLQERNASV